jgi:hypothetical protein
VHFCSFIEDLKHGKGIEIPGLVDAERMRHESDKNDSLGTCMSHGARSNVIGMPLDQNGNWSIVVSFDAQLIVSGINCVRSQLMNKTSVINVFSTLLIA